MWLRWRSVTAGAWSPGHTTAAPMDTSSWEKEIYTLIFEDGCTRQPWQCISAWDIEKKIVKLSINL